ncbi:metalloregulator ArsR/SmtB family transcription factor [uncultured Methanospirillum sp.]|uniref:ArsR/SmtB family transcription factor n=1 Tax=uncultured Methanospirillum sp. TaxID=262503 RepID=UPI0029C851BE|nr:metalloregulator ArsR/SmtB family transcription factor [uncultured Methanospirillum sp.]
MGSTRCCPADCALREDWEDELNQVKSDLNSGYVSHMEGMIKAVSHPLRLKILLMLKTRDQCVCEFTWIFDKTQTQISNHLKILRDAGIIETYYRSNHKIYRLKEDADISLITWMHQQWKKNCNTP